jgi:hypothetical protein
MIMTTPTLIPSPAGSLAPRALGRWLPLLAAALVCALMTHPASGAAPVTSPPRVLILDEMVEGGTNSVEANASYLMLPGCVVDIVAVSNWPAIPPTGLGGPTGFGFDSYRAIILGDPICTGMTNVYRGTSTPEYLSALNVLNATKAIWTPQVTGNVILEGVDNAFHAPSTIGAEKTIRRGIGFAVNDPNRTGLYYALSCYYDYTAPATNATLVPHLTGFGTFMTRNYPNQCFNDTHIVATHAVFTAAPPLTDSELSNWGCSTHEGFDVWPANFVVLAIALTNGAYTASDGSNGVPYILVRGEGVHVVSTIELGPPVATNNVGTTHTVCATLATNVNPKLNVAVTFTITSGPNAVTNYTTLTDVNGVACFTYTGMGGPGTDYITASYLAAGDKTNFSDTVSKIWVGACLGLGCDSLECLADGTYSYKFCVTNLTTSPITTITLQNAPPGVTITPNSIPLAPILNPGQGTTLTVNISAPVGTTSFCFLLSAKAEVAGLPPCSVPLCITLPTCCNRVISNSLTYVSSVGALSTYNYQFTIQNITGNPLKYIGFAADQSCVAFLPPLINLTLPGYGGPSLLLPTQTRTITVQVQKTAPCPGSNYFYMSTFTSNLVACCSSRMLLPTNKCVVLSSPYDGSAFITNTPVLFRAIPTTLPGVGPCGFIKVAFYQDTILLGQATHEPYELTVVPQVAGTYVFTAVATLESGEVQTSDPAQVTILAPDTTPHQHNAPGPFSAGVSGTTVLLNLPTTAGHQYVIEYRTNLTTGTWKTLQTFTGDGSLKIVTDPVTNDAARFYRAVSQP